MSWSPRDLARWQDREDMNVTDYAQHVHWPYTIMNTTAATNNVNYGVTLLPPSGSFPSKQLTALDWLKDQVEEICALAR